MLSALGFKLLLTKLINVGDRQLYITPFDSRTLFISFINLSSGTGNEVERENNRALFSVTGFNADVMTPVNKVQVSQITSVFDTKLRKKTGDPNKIAGYLAEHINALALAYEPKSLA